MFANRRYDPADRRADRTTALAASTFLIGLAVALAGCEKSTPQPKTTSITINATTQNFYNGWPDAQGQVDWNGTEHFLERKNAAGQITQTGWVVMYVMMNNQQQIKAAGVPAHEIVWTRTGHNLSFPQIGSTATKTDSAPFAFIVDWLTAGPGGQTPIIDNFYFKNRRTIYVKTTGNEKIPISTVECDIRGGPGGITFKSITTLTPTLNDPPDMLQKQDSGEQ